MTSEKQLIAFKVKRKIMMESADPQKVTGLIEKIGPETFCVFAFGVQKLSSSDTFVAFKALIRLLRLDVRRDGINVPSDDAWRFAKSVASVIPYATTGMQASRLGENVLVAWIAQIGAHLMSSQNWGKHTDDQIRGFVLMSFLGYKESNIDFQRDEMIWLGQRYDLLSENWHLFEERGIFDRDFITELEVSTTKSLLTGVL